jgi:hypothetical protein
VPSVPAAPVKTLGALPPQDELLEDTIQIVDQSLNTFVH